MDKTPETEAGVVAALAARAATPHLLEDSAGVQHLVLPEGSRSLELADPRRDAHGLLKDAPVRIEQQLQLQTVDSLVDYVDRFKGPTTRLFADIAASSIMAVLDYHGPEAPAHGDHKATLVLRHSVEWVAWKAQDGKMVDQQAFARWLEENAGDVVAPLGADLLEVCRDMQATRRANFQKVVRAAGDVERFEYTEGTEAKGKGSVEVPTKFQLCIPVYFGEPATSLYAFLRWRLGDGDLNLGYQLHRVENVRQAVFQQIVMDVAGRTGCPAVFGVLA
jgi:uncharacterized protein YfdQ (DUF2303 family)